jgi:hypothetical protein
MPIEKTKDTSVSGEIRRYRSAGEGRTALDNARGVQRSAEL